MVPLWLPAEAGASSEPQVTARSAIVIDVHDGAVLWESESSKALPNASTTKILTALVVLEAAQPGDVVTASARAEAIGETDPAVSELELKTGDRATVEELLYGLLLGSANDAAVALAEHVSGSVEAFVDRMNAFAAEANALDSKFLNPHGLDQPGHAASARDLARLGRGAFGNEFFMTIVGTQRHRFERLGGPSVALENRNPLLGSYPGANGMKTGQTSAAGKSLVASATRGPESRIAVVLDSEDPGSDASALLDYSFEVFNRLFLAKQAEPWGYVTQATGAMLSGLPSADLSVLVSLDEQAPRAKLDYQQSLIRARTSRVTSQVSVSFVCKSSDCSAKTFKNPVRWFWEASAPLLRAVFK